jgi:type II secretory pathway component PulC
MRRALFLTIVGLVACGPKVAPITPFDDDDPRAVQGIRIESAPDSSGVNPTASVTPVRDGVIDRARLVTILDQGPAHVLAGFEVAAEQLHGTFVGWRLVRFLPAGARFAALDILPGDVLLTVNHRSLGKPTDLSDLWAELYTADAIEAELRRGGTPLTIRFQITLPAVRGAGPTRRR